MGKNRRHKERQRAAGDPGFAAVASGLGADATGEQIGQAILTGALAVARGNAKAARQFAGELGALSPAPLSEGADSAGRQLVSAVFRNGWLPGDIEQVARRRVDEFAQGYLIDVMAAHVRPYPAESVDATWLAQLAAAGATVWWSPDEPHFGQWAAKRLLTPAEALATVIEALALLLQLPAMPLIRPLPGAARPEQSVPHAVDEKVLGRVRGLLAKAESTAYPEEAEALSAKAQELMTKYAIDRVLVDADHRAVDLPGARRLWLETPYVDAKALLVDAVAKANRCRVILSAEWGFVAIVGDETDLDAVELLTTSLLVQATRAMIASGNHQDRVVEARSRTFRKSFLIAYATRIGERLAAAEQATIAKSAAPERLLPVLAARRQDVDKAFETYFPAAKSSRISAGSAEGWQAGRAAANQAQLGAHPPIGKGRK
ncbi:DUF2786 domain-containing protein [Nocardia inohanensis]|uniref:DUF2786 domain-containing protein n=1 Tax=Nocardia inohanensis TaxID=209246 RepID=UPI000830DC3E|nr:DUF2786 domain-containing protein [Nocardia inohanensis]